MARKKQKLEIEPMVSLDSYTGLGPQSRLENLPDDCLGEIFLYLHVTEACGIQRASSRLRERAKLSLQRRRRICYRENSRDGTHQEWVARLHRLDLNVCGVLVRCESLAKQYLEAASLLSGMAATGWTELLTLVLRSTDSESARMWRAPILKPSRIYGETTVFPPLDTAIMYGQLDTCKFILGLKFADGAKIDLNARYLPHMLSPLETACLEGRPEFVRLLLADARVRVDHSYPLRLAVARHHTKVVDVLLGEQRMLALAGGSGPYLVPQTPTPPGSRVGKLDLPLPLACEVGHVDVVERLLGALPHVDVNERSFAPRESRTTLHHAAADGHLEIVRRLLHHPSIDVNAVLNRCSETPLMVAAHGGHVAVVRLLLDDPRVCVSQHDELGRSALHVAAQEGKCGVVKTLLEDGRLNLNDASLVPRSSCLTVSRLVARRAMKLVSNGDELCDPGSSRASYVPFMTPLHFAAQSGFADVVQCILNNEDCELRDVEPGTDRDIDISPLHLAARHGRYDVLGVLLRSGGFYVNAEAGTASARVTPLILALRGEHERTVARLLEEPNVDVNVCDPTTGNTALCLALERGLFDVALSILDVPSVDVNMPCVDVPNSRDDPVPSRECGTPLAVAAQRNATEVLGRLLTFPSLDVNGGNRSSSDGGAWWMPALHAAVKCDNLECVDSLLRDPRTDVNNKCMLSGADSACVTPVILALLGEHKRTIGRLLEEPNVDVNVCDPITGATAIVLAIDRGLFDVALSILDVPSVDVNMPCVGVHGFRDCTTPLVVAAKRNATEVLDRLLTFPLLDVNGSALHVAVQCHNIDCVDSLLRDPRTDVNRRVGTMCGGATPLHLAVRGSGVIVERLLCRADVDVNARDSCRQTPLVCAVQWKNVDAVRSMLKDKRVDVDWEVVTLAMAAGDRDMTMARLLEAEINARDDEERACAVAQQQQQTAREDAWISQFFV